MGLFIRLHKYATYPPIKAEDEVMYPLAFVTFIQTSTPSSWSNFQSYEKIIIVNYTPDKHEKAFSIVTPRIEKPPLFPIFTG